MSKASKRRKARREDRLARRQQRMDNKKDRRDSRSERKDMRLQSKNERQNTRQTNRTDRSSLRATTRQTAYENGIDPNGWISDSIGSVAEATSDVFQAKFNSKRPSLMDSFGQNVGSFSQNGNQTSGGGNNNMLLYGGLGLAAYFMLRK